jgi:tetratricopeptide (TPR) repeat protein
LYILKNKTNKKEAKIKKLFLVFLFLTGCSTKEYKLSGDIFIKSKEYEKAADQFKRWVNRDSDNPKAFVSLSVPYYKENDYKKSAEYLNKAFNINPDSAREAVEYYENLMEVDNYSWRVFYNGSKELLNEQQYKTASELIEKAEEANSSKYKAMAYALHGKILMIEGNTQKSIDYFYKAIELDTNIADAYIGLGEIYTNQNNTDKAIPYLKKAISLNSEYLTGYKLLGQNYLKAQKYDLAVEMLEKAYSLTNDSAILYALTQAYLQKEDYARAKSIAEKILGFSELDSNSKADAYITIGMADIYNQNYTNAIEALNEALRANPDNCDSYQLLALAYNKVGNLSLSKEFSEKWKKCVAK